VKWFKRLVTDKAENKTRDNLLVHRSIEKYFFQPFLLIK